MLPFACKASPRVSVDLQKMENSALATYCNQFLLQNFPPISLWGPLGDEDPVSLCSQGSHQRQVAAVSTHHLHDKRSLVAEWQTEWNEQNELTV